MDDEIKKMMDETARAERQRQIAELKAIDTICPDEIGAWLDGLETNLKGAAQKISTDVAGDIMDMMTTQLRVARKQIRIADDDNLKITIMTLRDNWHRLMANIDLDLHKRVSATQTEKSRKALAARWGDRDYLISIYEDLASKHDDWGELLPVAELWIPFYIELDRMELSPDEASGEKMKDTDRMTWKSKEEGKEESITYKTFRNTIANYRKND